MQLCCCLISKFIDILIKVAAIRYTECTVLLIRSFGDLVVLRAAPASAGLPPIEKLPPLGDCMGRPITCSSYVYPVGTVVFDANNHEAN